MKSNIMFLKNQLKQSYKSFWLIGIFVIMILVTFLKPFQLSTHGYHFDIVVFSREYEFSLVVLTGIAVLYGIYSIQKPKEYDFYLTNQTLLPLNRFLNCFLFLISTFLIPFIFSVIGFIIYPTQLTILFNCLLHIFLCTILSIALPLAIGFFIGSFVKTKTSYILGLLPIIFLTPFALQFTGNLIYLPKTSIIYKVLESLIIAYQNPNTVSISAFLNIMNLTYFVSKLLFIVLSIFFLALVVLQCSKRKSALFIMLISFISLFPIYNFQQSLQPKIIATQGDTYDYIYMRDDLENDSIKINSYKMDLNITSGIINNCTVKLNSSKSKIDFYLDPSFSINLISLNNKMIAYKKNGDIITIEVPKNEDISIIFDYTGKINYVDDLNSKIFMQRKAGYLPEYYIWYPKIITTNYFCNYDVKIKSDNTFVSNLAQNVSYKKGTYSFSANIRDIYIMKGYIDTVSIDGVKVTLPQNIADISNKNTVKEALKNIMINQHKHTEKNSPIQLFSPFEDLNFETSEETEKYLKEKFYYYNEKYDKCVFLTPFYNRAILNYWIDQSTICLSEPLLLLSENGTLY